MIRFQLQCDNDHQFESWFQNGAAFDTLQASGMVTCALCGSSNVVKSIMAPAVSTASPPGDTQVKAAATNPLDKIRDAVEKNADYVGESFASEATKMHLGDIPDRPIYGEAKPAEAKKMLDDGVPILPLPFIPRKRTH